MSATRDTSLLTEVIIGDDCFERLVAFIPVEAWTDTIAPGINSLSDCGDEVRILVREPGVRHAGIDSYRWDLLQNAEEISSIRDSNASVVSEIELRLRRLDPRQDIIYELTVIDEAGNRSVRRDTIGGFTLALLNVPGDTIGVRTGRNWESTEMFPGESRCDSVILVNYGLRPLTVDWARFVANVGFSLPPAQFPLVVPPGGRVRLAFCIRGMIAGVEDDTLMIVDKCQNVEPLALKVPVAGKLTGMESCGRAVSVATVGPARRAFVSTPLPNPADGQMASVDIGLVSATSVDLVLVSADGARIFPLFDGLEFTAGIHRILLDISTVAAGSYLCRMSTSDGFTDASRMIIVR